MKKANALTIIYTLLMANYALFSQPMQVYLIPGQGSDYRIFNNLHLDKKYDTVHIHYFTPNKGTTMKQFAQELSTQIDTNRPFAIVGISLGGMLATEMYDFMHPEKVILVSSAKCRTELPRRYRFQKRFPIYKTVGPKTVKAGAQVMQPIVEPDRRKQKETFKSMLADKDPLFLKRTIAMIMEWERTDYNKSIVHIHGSRDKTIPIRNVSHDYRVEKGSHMMILTRGKEISALINQALESDVNQPNN